jgi:hypothetical protein
LRHIVAATILLGSALLARAQGNYEIQVYGSEMTPKGVTMVEMHNNFTVKGSRGGDGLYPTRHAQHETLEVTHGFNEWFECAMYQFTAIQPDGSYQWVGTHIRPRLGLPERYASRIPVGLSLSQEIGYQRASFDPDTWTWELRPIIDKKVGKLYASFNPTLEKSFHGPSKDSGWGFSPNVKVSYDFHKRVAFGLEYYGAYGPWTSWDPVRETEQLFIPAFDIDLGKRWEFNVGVGVGVTQATDHLIVKTILGYRFGKLKD